jgi:DNA-cytosine methyltransferase
MSHPCLILEAVRASLSEYAFRPRQPKELQCPVHAWLGVYTGEAQRALQEAGQRAFIRAGHPIARNATMCARFMTTHSRNPGTVILRGEKVQLVSPSALARWKEIVLLEDDSARSARLGAVGVSDRASSVVLRVHRIGEAGVRIAADREYMPGLLHEAEAKQRADLGLKLLDEVPCLSSVVVCGPAYGASVRFLEGLAARKLDAVVEVWPSSVITLSRNGTGADRVSASQLLAGATWRTLSVPVAGIDHRSVTYQVAALGVGRLGSSPAGLLFAALTGGIDGVHRGTVFGLSLVRDVSLSELIETVGWARWIRPLVRRAEKLATLPSPVADEHELSRANHSRRRLRANIKLSRLRDQADATGGPKLFEEPRFRGALARGASPLNVVELFGGAGGMGLGFLLANLTGGCYRLAYAGEVDPIYARTLRKNHARLAEIAPASSSLIAADVHPVDLRSEETLQDIAVRVKELGGADIVIGGPPCQGFSNANRNSWHSSNPHNQLIDVFLNYVEQLSPRIFLLENVQGIHWTRKSGTKRADSSVLDHIQKHMAALGYDVFVQLLDAVWYGVPQYRSRFFILGIHRDLGYAPQDFGTWGPFPRPSHGPGTPRPYVTVWDAIGDLPPVGNGHTTGVTAYRERTSTEHDRSDFLSYVRAGAERQTITDHVTSRHADYVIERYKKIPPGGNWQSIAETLTNYADVNRTHSNIYRRLVWSEPSITIGHYRKSMLVHPSQPRGLSLREAARLQSFPDWFRFAGTSTGDPGGLVHKQQQLANAVCPLVTKAIAEFILGL